MRIALVHSYYADESASGENVVVDEQARALADAGATVEVVSQRTISVETDSGYRLRAAATVATGYGRSPIEKLEKFQPDVVHVHNLFPNYGTRWIDSWPGPIVATLHNFRPMCAASTLFRKGGVCTKCRDSTQIHGLLHGCYRDSIVATLPLTLQNIGGVTRQPLLRSTRRLVVLSERARRQYLAYGVQEDKLAVVPNFVNVAAGAESAGGTEPHSWVYVGRLTAEKGILQLLESWPEDVELDVIGDGPLRSELNALNHPAVTMVGTASNAEVRRRLPSYLGLIIPSLWFEGLPTTYIEALAAGIPIIAVEGSSASDQVAAQRTGVVLSRGYGGLELRSALAHALGRRERLRDHNIAIFHQEYSKREWVARITALYENLLR